MPWYFFGWTWAEMAPVLTPLSKMWQNRKFHQARFPEMEDFLPKPYVFGRLCEVAIVWPDNMELFHWCFPMFVAVSFWWVLYKRIPPNKKNKPNLQNPTLHWKWVRCPLEKLPTSKQKKRKLFSHSHCFTGCGWPQASGATVKGKKILRLEDLYIFP